MGITNFTLWGIYQIYPDLFDNCPFPEGEDINTLIDIIMSHSGMLLPWHQQPDHLKSSIQIWFTRKEPGFSKLFSAMKAAYNPIENYDRMEDSTETPDIAYTKTGGHSNTQTPDLTTTDNSSTSAYNSTTYQPAGQNTQTQQGTVKDKFDYDNEQTKESGTRTSHSHIHGNIGVTTSQQMIRQELELRVVDIYETIAKMFEEEFLIQVY